MGAYANARPGAPIKAQDEAKTSGLGEDGNTEWRPRTPIPFGLLPKTPIAGVAKSRQAPCPASPLRLALGVFGYATRLCP